MGLKEVFGTHFGPRFAVERELLGDFCLLHGDQGYLVGVARKQREVC